MKEKEALGHIPARCVCLVIGLSIMALGVAFSIKASLGTSPISSLPYVTSCISGLSTGTTTIVVNSVFVLIQILILRKQFEWFQLLQIPATIVFGLMIDVGGFAIRGITYENYFQQWLLCIVGILLVALGVSIEVMAKLVTTPGEGIVLSVCKVIPLKFGNVKVAFDVTLVCISVVTAFLCLGQLEGVREGTVAAALCVGLFTKRFKKPVSKFEQKYLAEKHTAKCQEG